MAAAKRMAAKQSGTAQPQLSGRERAQAMAKARIAAKNAPAPQTQVAQKAAPTPSGGNLKAGSFGISQKGREQATANRAAVAQKPQGEQGGTPVASASRKIDGAGLANTMRAQNNQSGGSQRQMSPTMQKRVAQTQVGTNAARAVQKVNPQQGQTVTTKQTPQGTTATVTGDTGSVGGNVNKAKRIIRNQKVGPTTMCKIDDF